MPRDTAFLSALLALVAAGGFFWWIYYRREFSVPSRGMLLAARLVSLLGVVLLLWNPAAPWGAERSAPRFVILDGSASMAASGPEGVPLWDVAAERAQRLVRGQGYRLLVAGPGVEPTDLDALSTRSPRGGSSTLTGALSVAAEAGARDIVVLTDRRVEDPLASSALARRLGLSVRVDSLPGAAPNVGVARLELPLAVERGEAIEGRVELQGDGAADSSSVTIRVDGVVHQVLRMPAPEGDGVVAATFDLPGDLAAGARVVEARIEGPDSFGGDDARVRVVTVDPEETGVLLVSYRPDWEARFLFPVLAQATGLPARGYLRVGEDRFLPLEPGSSDEVDGAALDRLMARAELLVLMGVDGPVASDLEAAANRARRLILFPVDPAGAALGGVGAGTRLGGEWYAEEPPPSPIAGALGDFPTGGLPPLNGVLPVVDEGGGSALGLRLGGAGRPESALVLRLDGRRRIATVLAGGTWRWAFRDGEPRERYRRLWSAVGGWMLADEPLAAGPGVRPVEPVLPPDVPTTWQGWGYEGDTVRVRVSDSLDAVVADTSLTVPAGGRFAGPELPPGRYAYTTVLQGDSAGGTLVVEEFTGDMLRRPIDSGTLASSGGSGPSLAGGGRPLRTSPFPYLLVLAALCAEWIGRRRAGLR